MTDIYGKGKKGTATKLHSKVVRTVGMCERCGESDVTKLQCAHIISRKYNGTRTDLRNAFCLCASCHAYFTDHPIDFGNYVNKTWAAKVYETLTRKSQAVTKGTDAFWQDRIDFLNDVYARIQEGELTLQEARLYETD